MQLGNGRWESTDFNKRIQATQVALGTAQNSTELLKLNYDYGTSNNGNLQSQTITVPTVGQSAGFTTVQTYAYDGLNRLTNATEISNNTTSWQQTFTYDQFGNRQVNTNSSATTASLIGENPTASQTTNRIVSQAGEQYQYDAAGNVIRDRNGNLFAYDGDGKQTTYTPVGSSQPSASYVYDSDGRRIKKVSGDQTTIFVYNASGQMVAEYGINTPQPQAPTTSYLTTDNLGTPRINTDQTGNVQARHDYLPFGEEIIGMGGRTTGNGYNADDVRQKYTGYQRDDESGLDFAQARYYASNAGRFTSVDPLMASARTVNPQTLNRYSYALNNPYRVTDASGMEPSGLDEQTDMAFQQLNELADHAHDVEQAAIDKAREEAEKKKKAQESVVHESLHQQTGPNNHQQGQAPQLSNHQEEAAPSSTENTEGPFTLSQSQIYDLDHGQTPIQADSQCVRLLQALTPDVGYSGNWRAGLAVEDFFEGNLLKKGTAVATFGPDGRWPGLKHGNHSGYFWGFTTETGQRYMLLLCQYPTSPMPDHPWIIKIPYPKPNTPMPKPGTQEFVYDMRSYRIIMKSAP